MPFPAYSGAIKQSLWILWIDLNFVLKRGTSTWRRCRLPSWDKGYSETGTWYRLPASLLYFLQKKKKKKINANVLFFFRSLTNGDIIHNLSYRYFRKIGQFHELPELSQFRLRSAVKVSLLFPVLQEKYKPLRIFHPFKWWNPFNFFVISRSHSKIIFRDKNQLKSLDFLF